MITPKIKVAPSILSADFSKLGQEIQTIDKDGADYIHMDVMDGVFVPNLTFGAPVIKSLRSYSKKIFDVHLMIDAPDAKLLPFIEAGADILTFHAEATRHAHRLVQEIHKHNKKAGLAINPATPIEMVFPLLTELDMVLVMTVNPGFGGQKFIESTLEKIEKIHEKILEKNPACELQVDGGITQGKIRDEVVRAGATVLVAGSAVFGKQDQALAISLLRDGGTFV